MDSYIYEESVAPPSDKDFLFSQKSWVEIADSNGKSYSSGKVVFNLDNISNSGTDYFNAKESIIMIPINLCVQVDNTTTGATASFLLAPTTLATNFIASLKNGSHQLIDKINFKINNNELITIDSFENCKIQYKMMSSWSQDNLVKRGDEQHFYPDSALSYAYDATQGVMNNTIADSTFSVNTGYTSMANKGRQNRMKRTSYSALASGTAIVSTSDMASKYQDFVQVATDSTFTTTVNFSIMCSFRLADLHPLFSALPLSKNLSMYLSLTLNVNSLQTLTLTNDISGNLTVSAPTTSSLTNTTPYQLSQISNTSDTGFRVVATHSATATVKSQISVCQVPTSVIAGSVAHPLTQCLFQACFVKMTAEADIEYSKHPSKEISWEDCYCQYGGALSNIASGGQVNQLLSGQFSKLRKLVILPFLTSASNGSCGLSPLNSTFASEPGTLSAYVGTSAVSLLNCRIGVNNVYSKDQEYCWEQYLQSAQGQSAINGGVSSGLSSGLITQMDWETSYCYRILDLSRHESANDIQPQSIAVKFKNQSAKTMDYIVMLYFEKIVGIDTQRGLLETFKS